jgi:hypothetical protein
MVGHVIVSVQGVHVLMPAQPFTADYEYHKAIPSLHTRNFYLKS